MEAGWSELPAVVAGNIIISLSLMEASTPLSSLREEKRNSPPGNERRRRNGMRRERRKKKEKAGGLTHKDVRIDEAGRREMKSEIEQTNRE